MEVEEQLSALESAGNLRSLPSDLEIGVTDFTSNDYLGFAANVDLRERFFDKYSSKELFMTASASRSLAALQSPYKRLEDSISMAYGDDGKAALLFNSGYHANTGIIPSLASRSSLVLADRLVHASIIDGIKLSGAKFVRFSHNDFDSLERLIEKNICSDNAVSSILIVVESIYSMDGDMADLERLVDIKRRYKNVILYVDEAHAVGAYGPAGLGVSAAVGVLKDVDILVGTFGKALASVGAFVLADKIIAKYLINKTRSFIFSTALPPAQILWTEFIWHHALGADTVRDRLKEKNELMARVIPGRKPSHIRPYIVGNAAEAVRLSGLLREHGFNVLPIRTPTVPPGTERLRFSISAAIPNEEFERLRIVMNNIYPNNEV